MNRYYWWKRFHRFKFGPGLQGLKYTAPATVEVWVWIILLIIFIGPISCIMQ